MFYKKYKFHQKLLFAKNKEFIAYIRDLIKIFLLSKLDNYIRGKMLKFPKWETWYLMGIRSQNYKREISQIKIPRPPETYSFSDAQNVYDRVVLIYTVSVIHACQLGRRPILRYQVRRVSKNFTDFTYSLTAHFYICYM